MDYEKYINEMRDLSKEVCIITDGNGENGFELANILLKQGATVILGVENLRKGEIVANQLNESNDVGTCIPMELNLKSLHHIKRFAENVKKRYPLISVLVHNANYKKGSSIQTEDRIESHFAINYVSHFALTGLLIKQLCLGHHSRVITVIHYVKPKGKIEFRHFHNPKNDKQKELYVQSKVASMFFAKKLDEHFRHYKKKCCSILCYVNEIENTVFKKAEKEKLKQIIPIVYSVLNKHVKSGDEIALKKDDVTKVSKIDHIYNNRLADNLWTISEKLTNVSYKF